MQRDHIDALRVFMSRTNAQSAATSIRSQSPFLSPPSLLLPPLHAPHLRTPPTMSVCSTAFVSPSCLFPGRARAPARSVCRARPSVRMSSSPRPPARGGGGNWAGEWICVDCGFVYSTKRRVQFEDLPSNWKCPQCNAPKRRFAKKAGDYIAETAATSNVPIILFSVLGLLATVAFGVWASANL